MSMKTKGEHVNRNALYANKHNLKATFHLTISMRGQRATGKIQRNNYHHGNCGPSLMGKTMLVFLISMQLSEILLTQRFLTFRCVPCVKINDALPVKDDPQFP